MEAVKDDKVEKNREVIKKSLEGLLYRKEVCEGYNERLTAGLEAYTERYDEIKEASEPSLKVEAFELENKITQLSTEHELNLKAYNFIESKIEDLLEGSEEEKYDPKEFEELKAKAKKIAQHELYRKCAYEPANVELPEMIHQYQLAMDVHKARIKELENKEKLSSKEAVELYEEKTTLYALENIHARRVDKYNNEFKPRYQKDMKQYHKYFERYMNRATIISKMNVDPFLTDMLTQYNKNKTEKKYIWKFWTTLRDRIDKICIDIQEAHKLNPDMVSNDFLKVSRLIIPDNER